VGGGWGFVPLALSNGDGTFTGKNVNVYDYGSTPFLTLATQPGVRPVAGDFNGDGLADVALVGGSAIHVAYADWYGNFDAYDCNMSGDTNFPWYATLSGATPVSGDFDGDGFSDIALTSGSGWWTVPIAFSRSSCGFSGANAGVVGGMDTAFPYYAWQTGVRPVAMP
jgi:hypothetical protein